MSYCLDEDVCFCNVVVLGGSALPQHQAGTGGHLVALNRNRRTFCCLEPEQWDTFLPLTGTGGHFIVLNRNRRTFCCLESEQWYTFLPLTGTGGHFIVLNRNSGALFCL